MYAWGVYMRDMRAPTYVQAKDRLVSIQQAASFTWTTTTKQERYVDFCA
jgi:hypothetical protein